MEYCFFLNPHSGVRLVWIHSCLKWDKYNRYSFLFVTVIRIFHSVESPSMVDPQWNILYWGSKWNLHTVCWVAVRCEWRTTSVYFEITYVCFIPSRLPVFAVEHQYQHQDFFIFVKSIIWRTHIKSSKKSCWFKIWMGFVGPILIKLETSSIWGFLVACVMPSRKLLAQTCWWPLSDHWSVQLTSPTCLGLCGMEVWKLNGAICPMDKTDFVVV